MFVQQQRQPETERKFQDRGDEGIDQGVEDGEPEDRIPGEKLVVFQPDEDPVPAYAGIGETEPDAEAERIGEKTDEEHR